MAAYSLQTRLGDSRAVLDDLLRVTALASQRVLTLPGGASDQSPTSPGRAAVRRVQGSEDSTRPVVAETSGTPDSFILR